MTTELETNIGERVKEYTETLPENSSYFIYIPTQGVVSENDNRVRDKHCSCRESEGIHRNSYRGVVSENDRVRDNIVAVERVKEYTETPRGNSENDDNRVRDKHCSCRERKRNTETPTGNSSYFIYIPTQGKSSQRMTTELETNIVAVERVKEYTETPTEVNSSYFIYISLPRVVSENDNRVRDKHCSCRESEGIHRNSYRVNRVVSENDNRVRDKHCSCRERKKYRNFPEVNSSYFIYIPTQGVVSENDNRELETNIVAVERVKEYTENPTEVNSSYFIYPYS
ncbi:unnamed protein product [Mytilus edulis]|uniref:SWIM-type domain-containing protein n=1 Tax=Mytilus edulis TaxID=6550 RepID=A0A8S3QVM0_MYTED|nr:unnamed protein product [Mytilus edulis]